MIKKLFGLLILVNLSFAACKKSENANKDKFVALTAQSWKPALVDNNKDSNPPGSVTYFPYSNCDQDDVYNFASNNKLTIDHGRTQCNAESRIEVNDYSVDLVNNKIIINSITYILAELSSTQLKFYAPIPGTGNGNLIYIFSH